MLSFYRPHDRVTLNTGDELMTKQSFKAECDIHNIIRQYSKTGVITHVQANRPIYTDLPDPLDYQTALNIQIEADQAFAGLPAVIRAEYGNDPGQFLAALHDPSQRDRLTEIGVFTPKAVQAVPDAVRPPPTSGAPDAA